MRRLLFTRHYENYTGGHGKVFDYMQHADAHTQWEAHVGLHPLSKREENPFLSHPGVSFGVPVAQGDDALFLAGDDWNRMPPDGASRVVVNLIQGVRHADPGLPLYRYLSRKAIRICVSHAVAGAIRATGEVRGPVHVIPPGLSMPDAMPAPVHRAGIFIYAHKQPRLGEELAAALRAEGHPVDLQVGLAPRSEFLARLGAAEIAIPLPLEEEGFFLPGLEAMAVGTLLVGVDAKGNRDYLRDGLNAIVAMPGLDSIMTAVAQMPSEQEGRNGMIAAGFETAAQFTLARERAAFHRILDDLEAQWAAT